MPQQYFIFNIDVIVFLNPILEIFFLKLFNSKSILFIIWLDKIISIYIPMINLGNNGSSIKVIKDNLIILWIYNNYI